MSFYSEWKNSQNTEKELLYIDEFLSSSPASLQVFLDGKKQDLIETCSFLLELPIDKLIDGIKEDCVFAAENIVQFSNFDHAVSNVPVVCETEGRRLSFTELGKFIMHSKLEGACKKYGENHSKLAAELSLVKLEKDKSFYVSNTALGTFFVSLSKQDKYELIKKLALRNCFIRSLIFHAKRELISYSDLALKVLSESTANRRKSNVKFVVQLILENELIKNNIVW